MKCIACGQTATCRVTVTRDGKSRTYLTCAAHEPRD